MKNMALLYAVFLFSLLVSPSLGAVQDFCIADYNSQETPSGFTCKARSNITAKNFVFSTLGPRTNTSNFLRVGFSVAIYKTFPAVNGLDISLARADIEPGGIIPLHSHSRGSETLFVSEGTLISGLITSDNKILLTTLNKGDVTVYPQGLLHFQYNPPNRLSLKSATIVASFNSDNPGIQLLPFSLFANDLPTEMVSVNTFINPLEIRRLKALFGGRG